MGRILLLLVPIVGLAGCDGTGEMRPAPVTRATAPGDNLNDHAATRPPRAIATH